MFCGLEEEERTKIRKKKRKKRRKKEKKRQCWRGNAPIEKNKNGVRKFSARFLVFYNKISTVKKIVLSSSRGQGNFRGPKASRPWPRPRTGGFEANAKAKDLKMCTRGRPRGLHL